MSMYGIIHVAGLVAPSTKQPAFSSVDEEDQLSIYPGPHPFKDQLWQLIRMEAWKDVVSVHGAEARADAPV